MTTCPDCDREMFSDRCPCGYTRASMQAGPAIRSTWRAIEHNGITKEEFGVHLFNAICLCGQILQLQGDGRPEYAKAKELADVFENLTLVEQKQLMQRYPKLFGRKAA